jgi:glutamate carboxypeptidase
MLRPEFEALGFTVIWKPMDQVKRAGHFIAVHKGRAGTTKMLLIGHLDTVFEPDSPFQTFKRDGDWAAGPGVGDDKGGVVTMLLALKAMQAAGTLKNANIEVVLTGDEEDSGDPVSISRADLVAAGKRADVALDFEGLSREDGKDMGSIARRSSNSWTLTTSGKSAHSSGIFSAAAGDGAVYEMARIITAFRKELPEPNLTFNVGLIGGGQSADVDKDGVRIAVTGKTNIIPPIAVAKGDFRTLSQDQTERVRAKMQAIVDSGHLPGTGASIAFDLGYPSMAPTAGNRALLGKLNGINKDLGLPEMPELDPLKRGAGDISFVAQDVDGLVGLGLASTGDHSPAEKADLSTMPRQAKRAAILMTRLSAEKGRK